jgi:hypothetical protein
MLDPLSGLRGYYPVATLLTHSDPGLLPSIPLSPSALAV